MGNFQKGGNRGGFKGGSRGGNGGSRGDFKKKSWGNDRGGDRERGPITMHNAVCAECKKNCEVPFRPNGEKPVLCRDCFGGNRDNNRGERSNRFEDRPMRRSFDDRSSQSFSKPVQNADELKKQINELNSKMDYLINLFEKSNTKKEN